MMVEEKPHGRSRKDLVAAAQLEKLNLEIELLRSTGRFERTLASYVPLLSVLIAVGGFLFGIYQFQRQQRIQQDQLIAEQQKDRLARDAEQAIRIQNQVRSNVEQILQFPKDTQQTISKLSFLLRDLRGYLELDADRYSRAHRKIMKNYIRYIGYIRGR